MLSGMCADPGGTRTKVLTMILGGSTNAVLHLIAIAHSVGIKLDIDDFQSVSDRIPFIADLKPSGKYVMEDVHKIGGIPSESISCLPEVVLIQTYIAAILHYLMKNGLIDGNGMTVTGRTLGENLERWTHERGELSPNQDVIRPLDKPIKSTGHLRYLTLARLTIVPT
jgi:dihydroxy-acid dehydratase